MTEENQEPLSSGGGDDAIEAAAAAAIEDAMLVDDDYAPPQSGQDLIDFDTEAGGLDGGDEDAEGETDGDATTEDKKSPTENRQEKEKTPVEEVPTSKTELVTSSTSDLPPTSAPASTNTNLESKPTPVPAPVARFTPASASASAPLTPTTSRFGFDFGFGLTRSPTPRTDSPSNKDQSLALSHAQAEITSLKHSLSQCESTLSSQTTTSTSQITDLQSQIARLTTEVEEGRLREGRLGEELERERQRGEEERGRREEEEREGRKGLDKDGRREREQWERKEGELRRIALQKGEEKQEAEAQLSTLRTSQTSLSSQLRTVQSQLSHSQDENRSLQLKISSLTSEVESTERDREFWEGEVERGRNEWRERRGTMQEEITSLQSTLESTQSQLTTVQTQLSTLRASHSALTTEHTSTVTRLSQTESLHASSTSSFKAEIEGQKRLVELLEARDKESKSRLEGIESAWEGQKEEWENWKTEMEGLLEEERKKRSEAEEERDHWKERAEELGRMVEAAGGEGVEIDENNRFVNLDASMMSSTSSAPGADPLSASTASRMGFGSGAVGRFDPNAAAMMNLSPSAAITSRLMNSGKTFTQIYSEYVRMQEELVKEREEGRFVRERLDAVCKEVEERAPLYKEQQIEFTRLSREAESLAQRFAQALSDSSSWERRAEGYRIELDSSRRENETLNNQLSDLSRQLRVVTRQLAGYEDRTIYDRSADYDGEDDVERIGPGIGVEEMTTDQVISTHLLTFKSITDLQVQNQKLLRIAREMGAKMESEERDFKAQIEGMENEAIQEAKVIITQLKEEVERNRNRIESLMRENEMFRGMVAHRSGGSSIAFPGISGSPRPGDSDGHSQEASNHSASMLAELQSNFDAYKKEMSLDARRLRDDLTDANRRARDLEVDLARNKSQTDILNERIRVLTEESQFQEREVKQIQKRASQLQDTNARQENGMHMLKEELIEVRGRSDRWRHENENLKLERDAWKQTEARLLAETEILGRERTHLADLMRNLQAFQNEVEGSNNATKRRLEADVDRLESQLQDAKERLAQEVENTRQASLRRELDVRAAQDKFEKLSSEHRTTRESLIAAQTSVQHLEQRVEDLTRELSGKEERLSVFESKAQATASEGGSESREKQLEIDLANTRALLASAKTEAEQAQGHAEQYKSIAAASEQALSEMNATSDEYKQSTETALAERDGEIKSLQERIHTLTSELSTLGNENSELHHRMESQRQEFEKEKAALQRALTEVQSVEERAREVQREAQEEVRRQTQVALDCQDKYDRELVAHAESVKELSTHKERARGLEVSVRELQTAVETAQANLESSTSSWARREEATQKETADLNSRLGDLKKQNEVLHDQLDAITAQATQIRNTATTTDEGEATPEAKVFADQTTDRLNEVIRYLRREKEISDMQCELSKGEASRLRQQAEYANRSLDDLRQQLADERKRANESADAAEHADLLQKVNELNILRESNVTLRDESERHHRKALEYEKKLRESEAQSGELRNKTLRLQAEIETREQQIKLAEQDSQRWKARTHQVLEKYDRIDPAELQSAQEEVARLKETLETLNREIGQEREERERLQKVAQETSTRFKSIQVTAREQRQQITDLNAEKASWATEKASLNEQLSQAQSSNNEQTKAQNDALAAEKTTLENEKKTLDEGRARVVGENKALEEIRTQLEGEKNTLEGRLANLEKEKEGLATALSKLRGEHEAIKSRNANLMSDNKRFVQRAKEHETEMAKIKADIEAKTSDAINKAVETRLAEAVPQGDQPAVDVEGIVSKRLAEAEAEHASSLQKAVDEAISNTTQKLQSESNKTDGADTEELSSLQTQLSSAQSELSATKTQLEAAQRASQDSTTALNELEKLRTQLRAMQMQLNQARKGLTDEQQKNSETLQKHAKELEEAKAGKGDGEGSTEGSPKFEELVAQRLAAQTETHQTALNEAVKQAVEAEQAAATARQDQALTNLRKELSLKQSLQAAETKRLKAKIQQLTNEASSTPGTPAAKPSTSTAPTTPSVPASTVASTSAIPISAPEPGEIPTTDDPAANTPAMEIRGRARGGVAGLPSLPGGKLTVNGSSNQSSPPDKSPATATTPTRGAGRGRGRGAGRGRIDVAQGAVGAALAGAGVGPANNNNNQAGAKRARESEGGEGTPSKKPKPASANGVTQQTTDGPASRLRTRPPG